MLEVSVEGSWVIRIATVLGRPTVTSLRGAAVKSAMLGVISRVFHLYNLKVSNSCLGDFNVK